MITVPRSRRRILCLLAVLPLAVAARERWEHIADYTDTRAMAVQDGVIYGASSRGGYAFDPATGGWTHFSITAGMKGVDLLDVCGDGSGTLFWAGGEGVISAWNAQLDSWSRGMFEFRDHPQIVEVYDLFGAGGRVSVSHSTGLTVFRYLPEDDEFLVERNLHVFGDFPVQNPVLASAVLDDWLVVATPRGLAWAQGYPDNIGAFQTWEAPGGLASVERAKMAVGGGRLYAAPIDPNGDGPILAFDGGAWEVEEEGVHGLAALAADVDGWVWVREIDTGSSFHISGPAPGSYNSNRVCGSLCYLNGQPWAALRPDAMAGGLAPVGATALGDLSSPDIPGAEEFVDLGVAPDGSLWAAGVAEDLNRNGLYRFAGDAWEAWRLGYGYLGNYPTSLLCDSRGFVWVGSWGNGVTRLDPATGEKIRYRHDSPEGQRIYGFDNDSGSSETFPLVSDVEEDAAGNIWLINHQAINDSFLVVIPAAWHENHDQRFFRAHYPQQARSFPYHLVTAEPFDVWAGVGGKDSRDQTKKILHLSGWELDQLPQWTSREFELADPEYNFGLEEAGQLTGLARDTEGSLWIATDNGFYFGAVYGGVEQFSRIQFISGLMSENLGCITVDPRDRVWAGSGEGLNVYRPDEVIFDEPAIAEEFNVMIRDLEQIGLNRVLVDGSCGRIWVATSLGLFTCDAGVEDYGPAPAAAAAAYPNPFRPDGDSRMRILPAGLANDALVSLYDIDGRLVRRLDLEEIEEGWDGRGPTGEFVAPGVYLLLVSSGGGTATGKVAVIR